MAKWAIYRISYKNKRISRKGWVLYYIRLRAPVCSLNSYIFILSTSISGVLSDFEEGWERGPEILYSQTPVMVYV